MDKWAPSTGDREGSAWRKNLRVGRVCACMSESMSRSVAIDPAGFIPSKVNTAGPSEEETVTPFARRAVGWIWFSSLQLIYVKVPHHLLANLLTKKTQRSKAIWGQRPEGKKLRVSVENSLGRKKKQIQPKGIYGKANRSRLDKKVQKTQRQDASGESGATEKPAASLAQCCCWSAIGQRQDESLSAAPLTREWEAGEERQQVMLINSEERLKEENTKIRTQAHSRWHVQLWKLQHSIFQHKKVSL